MAIQLATNGNRCNGPETIRSRPTQANTQGGIPVLPTRRTTVVGGLALASCVATPRRALTEGLDGEWYGAIYPNGQCLRLKLMFAKDSATLYSLDQGNSPISSTTLRHRGRRIRIEFGTLNVTIEGDMTDEWIVGEFRQGNTLPIGFTRSPIDPPTDLPLNHVHARAGRVGERCAVWRRSHRECAALSGEVADAAPKLAGATPVVGQAQCR